MINLSHYLQQFDRIKNNKSLPTTWTHFCARERHQLSQPKTSCPGRLVLLIKLIIQWVRHSHKQGKLMGLSPSHQKWKISPICPLWFAAMDWAKCPLTPRLANWVRFITVRSTMKFMGPICRVNKHTDGDEVNQSEVNCLTFPKGLCSFQC